MNELKPCPFCGTQFSHEHKYAFISDQGTKWGHVNCCHAEVRTSYKDLEYWKEDAVNEWNKRPIEDALNAHIRKLEIQLQKIDELLFGTDEPLEQPVNIKKLNDLFYKLRKVTKESKHGWPERRELQIIANNCEKHKNYSTLTCPSCDSKKIVDFRMQVEKLKKQIVTIKQDKNAIAIIRDKKVTETRKYIAKLECKLFKIENIHKFRRITVGRTGLVSRPQMVLWKNIKRILSNDNSK